MDKVYSDSNWGGKVFKCPACGMELNSFSSVCPACGSTVYRELQSKAIEEFEKRLTESDFHIVEEKSATHDDGRKKTYWVLLNVVTIGLPELLKLLFALLGFVRTTAAEKEKESIIKNAVFPDDFWMISSALMVVKEQISIISKDKFRRKNLFWAKVWSDKAEQLFLKCETLKAGDSTNRQTIGEISSTYKGIRDKHRKRALICSALWFIGVVLIVYLVFRWAPWEMFPSQEWPETGLATELPQPMNIETMEIEKSTKNEFRFNVYASKTYRDIYVKDLLKAGFTIDAFGASGGGGFEAKNSKGHSVKVSVSDENIMTVTITSE